MDSVIIDGKTVGIGDSVCFKLDVEQEGTIAGISASPDSPNLTTIVIENEHGFDGKLIGREKTISMEASRCWLPFGYKPLKSKVKKTTKSITLENGKAYIGDTVYFKCDVEQDGELVDIKQKDGVDILVLKNEDGFDGGYIGGDTETEMEAKYCWVE